MSIAGLAGQGHGVWTAGRRIAVNGAWRKDTQTAATDLSARMDHARVLGPACTTRIGEARPGK